MAPCGGECGDNGVVRGGAGRGGDADAVGGVVQLMVDTEDQQATNQIGMGGR
jgi:hypothetical protein